MYRIASKVRSIRFYNDGIISKSICLQSHKCVQARSFSSQRERELLNLPLTDVIDWLNTNKTTSEEVVTATLNHSRNIDKHLNTFIFPFKNTKDAETNISNIINQARQSDQNRKDNKAGKLEGVPIVIKDNFCTKGISTTASSKMLHNYIPPYDATVVARLKKEGAIIIGKTNMDEYGMGSTTTSSIFGSTVNPWSNSDQPRVAGGSSGGSAAAISARAGYAALGSDTGGSVRQPAAFCGIIGLKPSYGRTSRYGLISYASSLDTPAIFARSVKDASLILEVISGHDSQDSTSVPEPVPQFTQNLQKSVKGLTVGIPKEYYVKELAPEILDLWRRGAEQLEKQGAKIVEVSLPHTQYALSTYYILAPAEASSNLARYDGLEYGHREKGNSVEEIFSATRTEAFGEEVQRRILLGTFVLSRKSYESYYRKAQQIRRLILQDFQEAYKQGVDVLLTPTTPSSAFLISEAKTVNPVDMYVNDVMTIPASLAGLPAVSVPVELNSQGLPLGLQLIGQSMREDVLLNVAMCLENTKFAEMEPPLVQNK